MRHVINGQITFTDKKNNITGTLNIGKVKRKPEDCFTGEITRDGTVVSQVKGSYMGHMDFDDERYWDLRESPFFKLNNKPKDESLLSDTRWREDLSNLANGEVETAQEFKHQLEEAQRHDRKLREAAEKRRSKGGQKIDLSVYEIKDKKP